MKIKKFTGMLCASAILGVTMNASAGTQTSLDTDAKASPIIENSGFTLNDAFDKLWSIPVLYKNKENPFIQEVAFTGRYQGQIFNLNSNDGSAGGWQNRRQRFGGKVKFLNDFEAYIDFNLNFNGANTGRFVQNYEGFGLKWKPADAFNLEAGLLKVPITNEWRTSSKQIITLERSDFINSAISDKLGGILAEGKVSDGFTKDGKLTYGAGIYTATRSEDWAYPTFDGGSVIYAGVGYEFNKNHSLRYDNSFLVGNTDVDTSAAEPYSYTSALSYSGKYLDKKLWLQSDLVMAIGEDSQPDLFGFIFLPSYKLTEKIELVARYQYLVSNKDNGVSLQKRYERRAPELPTSKGNNYHALYGGVNYYIYQDKIKVMGGLEYSHMDLANHGSYDQVTLFGAVRVYF
jgi:phosphate-selective porin OprO and OprP